MNLSMISKRRLVFGHLGHAVKRLGPFLLPGLALAILRACSESGFKTQRICERLRFGEEISSAR